MTKIHDVCPQTKTYTKNTICYYLQVNPGKFTAMKAHLDRLIQVPGTTAGSKSNALVELMKGGDPMRVTQWCY